MPRVSDKININIIRGREFTYGTRHLRCEALWRRFAAEHADSVNVRVFYNTTGDHDTALQHIWEEERNRDEARCIFTEFDFLPEAAVARWPWTRLSLNEPIEAAEYITRDPGTLKITPHGIPGAWFIRISKPLLRHDDLNFIRGGKFNDPANQLGDNLDRQRVRLLKQVDHFPGAWTEEPFGEHSQRTGLHLFWSRHYHDDPALRPAGFALGDIQAAVDRELEARGV